MSSIITTTAPAPAGVRRRRALTIAGAALAPVVPWLVAQTTGTVPAGRPDPAAGRAGSEGSPA